MGSKVKHLASDNPTTQSLASGGFPLSGGAFQTQKKELAEVLTYFSQSNTYRVKTRGAPGNPNQPPGKLVTVPRKVENPNVTAPLAKGTVVILCWDLGFPFIDGVLNVGSTRDQVEKGVKPVPKLGVAGSTVPDSGTGGGGYYRFPGMPDDALPGDFAAVTPDGNYIAALQGKESAMYGSEKAQVRVFGNEGLVRTICENFEQLSSLGMLEIKNDGGRCNLKFRAAADQLTESGGAEEQWTFHLDIGDKGDFFDMRVTTPSGATLSRFYMSADGHVEVLGVNGVSIINAGKSPRQEDDGGDVIRRVQGNVTETVQGSITQATSSKRVSEVSEDDRLMVGHNRTASVNNHDIASIGGNVTHTINGGDPLTATPLNTAVDLKVLNGSYRLDIGNPLHGASPAAMAGYGLFVHNGAVTFGQDPSPLSIPALLASVSLNTILPNSVALGGTVDRNPATTTNPAMLHACMFEPLAALLSTLIALLDSHTHATSWGPSGPAMAPVPGGFATAISPMSPLIQSLRVLIGA